MTKGNLNLDFSRKNRWNEEIKDNELMSKKLQKVCKVLNYPKYILIFVSPVSGCDSISEFALLVENTVGITSSEIGLKIFAITAAIKKYKLIIERKRKKHNHIALLSKTKINTIEILVSKALSNSFINHEQFGE